MLAIVIAEAVAIALLAVLVLGLLRSHALILRALHELGAGLDLERDERGDGHTGGASLVNVDIEAGVMPASRPPTVRAPAVVGTTLAGEEVTIGVQGAGRRTLLAFLSSGCSVCQTFWSEFSTAAPTIPGDGRLVVIAKGPNEESAAQLRELAGPYLEVIQSPGGWTDYAVPGSPYFVYVEDGLITGEGSSTSWAQVRDLMSQAVADMAHARRRAGRSGPGVLGEPVTLGPIGDIDIARVDRELLDAGITPGHPSLRSNPEDASAAAESARPRSPSTDDGTFA